MKTFDIKVMVAEKLGSIAGTHQSERVCLSSRSGKTESHYLA